MTEIDSSCARCGGKCCQDHVLTRVTEAQIEPMVLRASHVARVDYSTDDRTMVKIVKNDPACNLIIRGPTSYSTAPPHSPSTFDVYIPQACPSQDEKTGLCLQYDNRPDICRDYQVGSRNCMDRRRFLEDPVRRYVVISTTTG